MNNALRVSHLPANYLMPLAALVCKPLRPCEKRALACELGGRADGMILGVSLWDETANYSDEHQRGGAYSEPNPAPVSAWGVRQPCRSSDDRKAGSEFGEEFAPEMSS